MRTDSVWRTRKIELFPEECARTTVRMLHRQPYRPARDWRQAALRARLNTRANHGA